MTSSLWSPCSSNWRKWRQWCASIWSDYVEPHWWRSTHQRMKLWLQMLRTTIGQHLSHLEAMAAICSGKAVICSHRRDCYRLLQQTRTRYMISPFTSKGRWGMRDINPYQGFRAVRRKRIIICDGLGAEHSRCICRYHRWLMSRRWRWKYLSSSMTIFAPTTPDVLALIADSWGRCERKLPRSGFSSPQYKKSDTECMLLTHICGGAMCIRYLLLPLTFIGVIIISNKRDSKRNKCTCAFVRWLTSFPTDVYAERDQCICLLAPNSSSSPTFIEL